MTNEAFKHAFMKAAKKLMEKNEREPQPAPDPNVELEYRLIQILKRCAAKGITEAEIQLLCHATGIKADDVL
jgi:hypothetical protein